MGPGVLVTLNTAQRVSCERSPRSTLSGWIYRHHAVEGGGARTLILNVQTSVVSYGPVRDMCGHVLEFFHGRGQLGICCQH